MTQEIVVYSMSDMERLATAIAKSKLFGMQTQEQALALMAIAQAEGLHPAIAARDYHIVQGRPTLKADAMLARFQAAGGKVEWHSYTDECCDATLSHPSGGTVRIIWDMERVKQAEIKNSDMYRKYPRNMLRARVISEGIRTVYPGVVVGTYTPEEASEFEPPKSALAQWAETPPSQHIEQKKTEEIERFVNQKSTLGFNLREWAKTFADELKIAATEDEVRELMTGGRENLTRLHLELPAFWERIGTIASDKLLELANPPVDMSNILEIPEQLRRTK